MRLWEAYHRMMDDGPRLARLVFWLAVAIGLTVAAIVMPLQLVAGDLIAVMIVHEQPEKLAAAEGRPDQIKTRKTTNRQETGKRGDTLELGPAQYSIYQHYSQLTDKQLPHNTGNRVNPDRAGNAGRMNVRADPQGQVGTATQLRAESVPVPVPHMNGGRFQNYLPAEMYKMNQSKANANPLASPKVLGLARDVLKQNPIALPPLAVV